MNELFYTVNDFFRDKFAGRKVLKIPLNAGFTCPNKDGTISSHGCLFCDRFGSGPIRTFNLSLRQQIELFRQRHPRRNYIAYFQSHTNTHAPVTELEKSFSIIFDYPDIVGLFIGTRPDAIAADVFPLLAKLNRRTYLAMELGLQSVHARSLAFLHRNHTYNQFLETFKRLKQQGIDVVVHLIIGIPGESRTDMLATITEMNRLKPAGVKFHLFHVLKGTPLHACYLKAPFPLLSRDEYVELLVFLLERLDPEIVIHRLTAEREKSLFFAPEWALDKTGVIDAIKKKLAEKQTFQGKSWRRG